ncbi:NAD(P)/FAD-dependent oxidoreductase [Cognatishimia sp. D5M38]|uniref:NAD(P)/FAD-dependent oxidoreductase n=1 Tax=Cognatishimia coralii TaxID=3083254 RepID=A0ABU8QKW2_9RHOB
MDEVEVVVIGAGVVGMAIAREASMRGHDVLVVDALSHVGGGISSRNSEVIHAGIYYPVGSEKALHCKRGRQMLYDYCATNSVPFRKTGKLIVATSSEDEGKLAGILEKASANGLNGEDSLQHLTKADVRKLEPELYCKSALFSPSTGIIDSHTYINQLMADACSHGADVCLETTVEHLDIGPPHCITGVSRGERFQIATQNLFIAAGLHSASLCRSAGISSPDDYWLKGNYFVLDRPAPFRHLVYPVPAAGGLGVHLTLDLAGSARFGPDTEPVSVEDYRVSSDRVGGFERAIRRYWPGLPDNSLTPGYSGIRPKLRTVTGNEGDFCLDGPGELGVEGLVALNGIESPGLTSSLSIGIAAYSKIFEA